MKKDSFHLQTNSGFITFKKKGKLDFIKLEAFYNEDSVANILPFHELNAFPDAHMYYDGSKEDVFKLIYDDGRILYFVNDGNSLYKHDVNKDENGSRM